MLAITLALVAYGLISRKIEGSILTGPTLFTVFGLVAGPAALGMIPLQMGNEALHLLVEVTLILVLFSDAANIDLAQLRRDHNLPVRMLLLVCHCRGGWVNRCVNVSGGIFPLLG